jgi:epoxyqueuosine reductase
MSDLNLLAQEIKVWARALGFAELRITDVDLSRAEAGLLAWLAAGYHGEMGYMDKHGLTRARPAELVPGSVRALSVRMNYLPREIDENWSKRELKRSEELGSAVISIYARGRDYHKVLRKQLQQLAVKIQEKIGSLGYRVFTDSAPVMEVELATKAGLGWRGKHTLLLNREAGSMFFLGEILIDLPLPVDAPISNHCGQCRACIDICPTQAIRAPYQLDARRCISYLTIEHQGSIPVELRPLIGNRVYGCDDCQLACPWNKFAQPAQVDDFEVRNGLDSANMLNLFQWTEAEFLNRLEGSPIRRIGYERWLRNLAVGLGNALKSGYQDEAIVNALNEKTTHPSALVREHVLWALE